MVHSIHSLLTFTDMTATDIQRIIDKCRDNGHVLLVLVCGKYATVYCVLLTLRTPHTLQMMRTVMKCLQYGTVKR